MLPLLPLLSVATAIDLNSSAKLLGWTPDGHHLVWTETEVAHSSVEPDNPMEEPAVEGTLALAIVYDVRRGDRQVFVTKQTGKPQKLLAGHKGAGNAAAFAAWQKKHPLSKVAARRGKAGRADVAVKLEDGEPAAWHGDAISWSVSSGAKVTLRVTCGKYRNTAVIDQDMGAMYAPSWTARPLWAPTGRDVAFLLEEAVATTMRGPDGGRSQIVLVACGPRVEVVAPPTLAARTEPVAAAVEGAGFTVTSIGVAKAQRATTVIYAAPAFAAEAARLAKAIPGGATVDKLTWKPSADLVVALGASAK